MLHIVKYRLIFCSFVICVLLVILLVIITVATNILSERFT